MTLFRIDFVLISVDQTSCVLSPWSPSTQCTFTPPSHTTLPSSITTPHTPRRKLKSPTDKGDPEPHTHQRKYECHTQKFNLHTSKRKFEPHTLKGKFKPNTSEGKFEPHTLKRRLMCPWQFGRLLCLRCSHSTSRTLKESSGTAQRSPQHFRNVWNKNGTLSTQIFQNQKG